MPRNNKVRGRSTSEITTIDLSNADPKLPEPSTFDASEDPSRPFRRSLKPIAAVSILLLLGLGVLAKNGWLPHTDSLTGQKTGWFGSEVPKNAVTGWNPFVLPTASPTPQLSKENIYAGSKLIAVEDANANAVPPTDLAVWRPSDGNWYIINGQTSQQTNFRWGQNGDSPQAGDFDGDGKTDFSVYRPDPVHDGGNNLWYIHQSSNDYEYTSIFGASGTDLTALGDYDGDGRTDLAAWGSSTHNWCFIPSSGGNIFCVQYGVNGDLPAPGDYDGDGRTDICLWRSSNHTFYYASSIDGVTRSASFGSSTDTPISADYDGDGKTDFALFTASAGNWTILQSSNGQTVTIQYGQSGDKLVPNDYDGDGKVDLAVWRVVVGPGNPGIWYIRQSHDLSTRSVGWGKQGDIPVPALYRR